MTQPQFEMISVLQPRSRGNPTFLTFDLVPQCKEVAEALHVTPRLFLGGHDMMLVSMAFVGSVLCRGISYLSGIASTFWFFEAIDSIT